MEDFAIGSLAYVVVELGLNARLKSHLALRNVTGDPLQSRDKELRKFLFSRTRALGCMGRVDFCGTRSLNLREALESLLQHGQFGGLATKVVHFLVDTTEIDARLIELPL